MSDFIAKAWDKVKGEDDADYASASGVLKADLQTRADGITRKGVTTLEASGGDREPTVFDEFEAEFKRLSASKSKTEAKDAPATVTTKAAPPKKK